MCGGPSRGLECLSGRVLAGIWHWLGPGNTNQWPGWVLPRYSTPPGTHPYPTPGTTPPPTPTRRPPVLPAGHHETAGLRSAKEILGVEYARVYGD